MPDDPCAPFRRDLEAAIQEWRRYVTEAIEPPEAAASPRPTPRMGGQLGSRHHETIARREAAQRRYRSAVRALSECLRQSG